MATRTRTTRRRRTGEEAKTAILKVAERRLTARGINGLKLQEMAKDLKVSHPAILHHFGSRKKLVDAVVDRVINSLLTSVEEAMEDVRKGAKAATVAEALFECLAARENARKLAWLALGDGELKQVSADLSPVVKAVGAHLKAASKAGARQVRTAAATLVYSAIGAGVMGAGLYGGAKDVWAQQSRLSAGVIEATVKALK